MIINFGTRRLQKGSTSYTLPIPPQWINSVGVGKGAMFNIETIDENSLKISPLQKVYQGHNE
jgi:hypothetical protein